MHVSMTCAPTSSHAEVTRQWTDGNPYAYVKRLTVNNSIALYHAGAPTTISNNEWSTMLTVWSVTRGGLMVVQ